MWQSYFYQIQSKYSMRLSIKNPLVIRLDGKDVTKNKSIDLLNKFEGSFMEVLEKTVEYFTRKYHCYSIFGSDEVSFIITNPMLIIEDLSKDKTDRANEIIALFAQYFFDYFNNFNKNTKIFWHGKCFSIKNEKIISYLKFRSRIIKNVMTTYFLKKKNIYVGNTKLEDKENKCKKYDDYEILEKIQNGILYFDGKKIDLDEFYNGNIKVLEDKNKELKKEMFLNLLDF